MILRNPDNGADIRKDAGGKWWEINVGETLEFKDEVGQALFETYGFLEIVEGKVGKPEVKETLEEDGKTKYSCSVCGKDSSAKVAILNHVKTHKNIVEAGKAKPVGKVEVQPSLSEERAMRRTPDYEQGFDNTFFGDGFQESRRDPLRRAGKFGLI